jgi:hypothetical protein
VELCAGVRRALTVDGLRCREAAKPVWRSSQHHFEDAAVFCPAGLSAAGAACLEEARCLHGVDLHASRTAMALESPTEAAGGQDGAVVVERGAGVFAASDSPNVFCCHRGCGGAGGWVVLSR